MKHKRALLVVAGLLLVCGLALMLYKLPFFLVKTGEGHSPQIMEITLGDKEFTQEVNEAELLAILSQAKCQRNVFPKGAGCYYITEDLITIWIWDIQTGMSRRIHLSPSKQKYYYYNDNHFRWEHQILRGSEVYEEVLALIPIE